MDFHSQKVLKDQEYKLQQLIQTNSDLEDENLLLKKDLSQMKYQKEDLERSVLTYQQEADNQRLALERRAELTVDDRAKAK